MTLDTLVDDNVGARSEERVSAQQLLKIRSFIFLIVSLIASFLFQTGVFSSYGEHFCPYGGGGGLYVGDILR